MSKQNGKDDSCPVCKADRYLNPSLKLLVSPCFHKMCVTCIDRLFTSGPAPCPVCKGTLRKSNFVVQTFNKRIEDFGGDLKAFNNYLEDVEDILFNLINNVDVEDTTARIEKFRLENKELISANISKQINEDKNINFRLEKEKKDKLMRKEIYMNHIKEEAKMKVSEKEELIRQLAESDKSTKDILKEAQEKRKLHFNVAYEVPEFEDDTFDENELNDTGFDTFDPVDNPYDDPIHVPMMNMYQDPWTESYKTDNRQKAGGFQPRFTYGRAIDSAFTGIFNGLY
ncbi:TFIIH/NER complex subunit [Clydaea vesicula]|uniref:RNA polymerase II transcription factor B subunit 3 n=1 Tax=Clydaea vesicula TaxID=447962 RepID=A0AAD5U644_9FUNG|nr:TFIIH/NER complex subunit [Clydaea vesicula]